MSSTSPASKRPAFATTAIVETDTVGPDYRSDRDRMLDGFGRLTG